MSSREVFFTEGGALRAPWRIAVFAAVSMTAVAVIAGVATPFVEYFVGPAALTNASTDSWIELLGVLAGTAITLRLIDKRPWSDVWLDRAAAEPRLLARGFAIGALAIGLPILLLIGGHWLRKAGAPSGSWVAAAGRVTLFLAPAALLEELITRGYILSVLKDSWGWGWSITAMSLAFGALHLANNGASAGSVALVTLAGFFLAAVLYATRSLYAAWMAHLAWNWTMAVVFHASVSGYPLEAPAYRYVDAGPDWATGGVWGPEGGVPAGVGMCAGIMYLVARRRRGTRWAGEHPTDENDSTRQAEQES